MQRGFNPRRDRQAAGRFPAGRGKKGGVEYAASRTPFSGYHP